MDAAGERTTNHEQGIVARDLWYQYPASDRPALEAVSMRFERGRLYSVLGRNGSGKSTLARCLNALLTPTRGTVTTCGMDSRDPLNTNEIRKRVAMVFQNPDTQLVGTTLEEEVAFGPENLALPCEEIRSRVDDSLEMVGLGGLRDAQPQRLSQGTKQLAAIAGALAMRPVFLVSDESTSMLDHRSRTRVMDIYRSMRDDGAGVIHVTHFLEEAARSDLVVVLDGGEVVAQGPPGEVLGIAESARRLGLDPLPVTLVSEELRSLGLGLPGDILTVEELISWAGV